MVAALPKDPQPAPKCVVLDEFPDGLSNACPQSAPFIGLFPANVRNMAELPSPGKGVRQAAPYGGASGDTRAERGVFVGAQQDHTLELVERPQDEHL
jgi:hypothetical protein